MKLAEFARWAIQEGNWRGATLDGGDIQDKAVACGIIQKTQYDPAKHGPCEDCEPGDDFFVFSADFLAALHF